MNIYEALNKVITYIEDNLDKEININKIAQILGTNKDTAKRLFSLITNISLNEYIKKRRLSKAAYDIDVKREKIIDVALKYGYENPVSFSRAFKRFHGKLPKEIKKKASYNNFLPFNFNIDNNNDLISLTIKNINRMVLYGIWTNVETSNVPKKSTPFWNDFKICSKNAIRYGVLTYNSEDTSKGKYWICLPYEFTGSDKLVIKEGKYLSITCPNTQANLIKKITDAAYFRNSKDKDYKLTLEHNIEIYYNNQVEILLPIH